MSDPDSATFCPIPWNFQASRNNGDIRICCQANVSKNSGIVRNEAGEAYNAKNGNLIEARNAPLMKQVRKNMMEGRWSKECIRCQEEEASGLNSRRQYEMFNWPLRLKDVRSYTDDDGTIDVEKTPIQYYDLRFGNKCNLACRMCGPTDSDLWYNDYVKLRGETHYNDSHGRVELEKKGSSWFDKNKTYQWYESEAFWKSLEKFKDGLQHIYMAGGEPLLIKEHYKFLENCVTSKVSENIILEYNTNLTILPNKVLDLWSHFKQVRVGASIDGYGDVFEFQRYPARWNDIYKNLQKLDELPAPVFSWMACTVTIYNVLHIPEFIRWKVEESGFKRINSGKKRSLITHHMAHKPDHLNVRVLSENQKKQVVNKFKEYRSYFQNNFSELHFKESQRILDSIETYMMGKSLYDKFSAEQKFFTETLDKIRDQNSEKFVPSGR